MLNPWEQLPNIAPFILPEDKELIDKHNNRWAGTDFEILLNEIPSPYIGDPKAPIVLLNLNPGYSLGNQESPNLMCFREVARANLLHQFFDYPYYVLDPTLEGTPSGYTWFMQNLGPLMRAGNLTPQELSKKLFTVEYFPYHSVKYGWKGGILPSQKYAIHLLKEAIGKQAIIVIMRGKKVWETAVPELIKYPNVYTLSSSQNVTVSEKNLGYDAFYKVIDILVSC